MTIKAIFLDVGGVLLTNGWDHLCRKRACEKFGLDFDEMEERHPVIFDLYEREKITLDEYLEGLVFYKDRPFTMQDFKDFMYNQSEALPYMIDYMKKFKAAHPDVRIVIVSNEGRELMNNRIQKFSLKDLSQCFIVSAFVHYRKPAPEIFIMALEINQVLPEEVIFIDDRQSAVDVAQSLGMHAIHHTSYETTKAAIETLV